MALPKLLMQQLLDWLTDCADAGDRCPSNAAIADRFGFVSVSTSASMLAGLEKTGQITVERFQSSRVVTIVATGAQTLKPANAKPHWRAQPVVADVPVAAPKPRISATVIRAAKIDGRELPDFVTALIDMGLDCWRDDRVLAGEPVA